jgi:hypothetical protein
MGGPTTFSNLYSTSKFTTRIPASINGAARVHRSNRNPQQGMKRGRDLPARVGRQESTVAKSRNSSRTPNPVYATPRNIQKYADFMFEVGSIKIQGSVVEGHLFSRDSHLQGN